MMRATTTTASVLFVISMAVSLLLAPLFMTASAQNGEEMNTEVRWYEHELQVDSFVGRLLDATLTLPEGVEHLELQEVGAYDETDIIPPSFLDNLLIEKFLDARPPYAVLSSLEPIQLEQFQLLLRVNEETQTLAIDLGQATLPERAPKKQPLLRAHEVMQWILSRLSVLHGVERAVVLTELRRLIMDVVYSPGNIRPMLRASNIKLPTQVLKSIYNIAAQSEIQIEEPLNLLAEPELLRHLLDESESEFINDEELMATINSIDRLERKINDLNMSLSQQAQESKRIERTWWLQYRIWWFIAGICMFAAVIFFIARAFIPLRA